jgi:hypothetical protein
VCSVLSWRNKQWRPNGSACLHQAERGAPVDVQIGPQLYEDAPQELRSRLWVALLDNASLARRVEASSVGGQGKRSAIPACDPQSNEGTRREGERRAHDGALQAENDSFALATSEKTCGRRGMHCGMQWTERRCPSNGRCIQSFIWCGLAFRGDLCRSTIISAITALIRHGSFARVSIMRPRPRPSEERAEL